MRLQALLGSLLLAAPVAASPTLLAAKLPAASLLAIVDATVIPLDRDGALEHQTILVQGDRIAKVGAAASVEVPPGAARIDGRGRFVIPGLIDSHAHFAPGAGDLSDPAGRLLALLVANGVTTARSLGGPPSALAVRERVRKGEVVGPALFLAAPSLHGQSVHSADEARQQIAAAKAKGYDLLKTHGGLSRDIYDAMIAAAKAAGLRLSGHVTPEVGLRHAMESGQQIEHLDGWLAALVKDGVAPAPELGGQLIGDPAILATVDEAKIADLARLAKDLGSAQGPTLALFEALARGETLEQLAARPELRYAPPAAVGKWREQVGEAQASMPPEGGARFIDLRHKMVRALHDAGATLLAGSDSPQLFGVPGFSLHRELAALERAGVPPLDVLRAASKNGAAWLGQAAEVGTVTAGKRADLVLLDADPRLTVANAAKIAGVVLRGKHLDRAALDALLRQVEAEARKAG